MDKLCIKKTIFFILFIKTVFSAISNWIDRDVIKRNKEETNSIIVSSHDNVNNTINLYTIVIAMTKSKILLDKGIKYNNIWNLC